MLIGLAIKMISKFNTITNDIRDLREDLNSHASVISDVKLLQKDALALDKKFDIHLSSYANRNDVVQMVLGQINEKIDHKWERVEGMIKEVREETKDVEKEVKDVQKYLQKQGQFTIRDYPDR
jgi:gas vesicle protein